MQESHTNIYTLRHNFRSTQRCSLYVTERLQLHVFYQLLFHCSSHNKEKMKISWSAICRRAAEVEWVYFFLLFKFHQSSFPVVLLFVPTGGISPWSNASFSSAATCLQNI